METSGETREAVLRRVQEDADIFDRETTDAQRTCEDAYNSGSITGVAYVNMQKMVKMARRVITAMRDGVRAEEPLTYRQIKEYADRHMWEISPAGYDTTLVKRPDSLPWGVCQWLLREALPTARTTGKYEFPQALDVVCPYTTQLAPARYVTQPVPPRQRAQASSESQ
jgi:hypothetical protein